MDVVATLISTATKGMQRLANKFIRFIEVVGMGLLVTATFIILIRG